MDFFVAAHGVVERLFIPREARWVENDEVILGFSGFQEIEDVCFDDFDVEVVEFGVAACGGAGGAGDIDGGDFGGTGFFAGQGEAALVGEAIEDAEAFGHFRDFLVCLKLIEVEAGFLAVDEIDLVVEAICIDREGAGVFSVNEFDALLHAFSFAGGGVVAEGDGGGVEDGDECIADDVLAHIHGEGGGLDAEMISVAVYDEAGDTIGF